LSGPATEGRVVAEEGRRDDLQACAPDDLLQAVAQFHVGDLVGQDAGHFFRRAGLPHQGGMDHHHATWRGKGIDVRRSAR
jgi:hypothetical protein